jgi:tRNA nucleotidyltransferase/poly(A) polymerase
VLLGLKLDRETAEAMKAHASACSPEQGMLPPRRIWLELNKLHKAETKAPGSCWPKALKLSYALGLLPCLFPWLRASEKSVMEQAVLVASKMVGGEVPLELKVAALVHPGAHGNKGYEMVRRTQGHV